MRNIIIVGGGTAGWLTALYVKKTFPQHHVTLMESKSIGILGAGEGSTAQLVDFLKMLDVNIPDLIKATKGTIKQGISFENWNGDGNKYFHPFGAPNNFSIDNLFGYECYDYYLKHLIHRKMPLKDHTLGAILSYKNIIDERLVYALHFDAQLLANYLQSITQCNHVYDDLKEVNTDEQGNIISINNMPCDFVFDCTGFNRKLIGEMYGSNTFSGGWKKYKCLPINRAIPFFLPPDNKPYTQAIAMKHGWCWKIPLQHRYGAGYVFDSDYISDEQAFEEAKEMFPDIEYTRTIRFEGGRYKRVWINNCLAIGLSSGFTEPLEATSIWMAIEQLRLLESFVDVMFVNDKDTKEEYNMIIGNNNDDVVEFLYLHYMSKRNDSPFWREFSKKNKIKDFDYKLNNIRKGNMRWYSYKQKPVTFTFDLMSWLHISEGLGLIDNMSIAGYENLQPSVEEYGKSLSR